ncbi:hypothetical protein S245_038202 [Arachis hypogaea]
MKSEGASYPGAFLSNMFDRSGCGSDPLLPRLLHRLHPPLESRAQSVPSLPEPSGKHFNGVLEWNKKICCEKGNSRTD